MHISPAKYELSFPLLIHEKSTLKYLKITFYMIVRKQYEHIEVMFRILLQLCQHTDNKLNSR